MPFNPTQIAGVASFTIAGLACAWAARRGRPPWAVLAVVHAGYVAEILFGGRHRLHGLANRVLEAHGWYGDRGDWQIGLLAALGLVAAAAAIAGGRSWRRRPVDGRWAIVATAATAVLFAVETISWHMTDRLLYRSIGPVLAIAWVWAGLAASVVWSALMRAANPSTNRFERRHGSARG